MRASDFDYHLPEEQIATRPTPERDQSRLLVLDRDRGSLDHRRFADLPEYLRPGDALVLNETRVRHARLIGHRSTGGRVDLLLLARHPDGGWEALVRPSRRVRAGERVVLPEGAVEVLEDLPEGRRRVRVLSPEGGERDPEEVGEAALPPYIPRDPEPADRERYQTVYATEPGAVAAPTAGLHFTPDLLEGIESMGVHLVRVVLHVGVGTFRPVTVAEIDGHMMDAEFYRYPAAAVETLREVRGAGGRVIAVGTTSVRVLETVGADGEAGDGWTDLFIRPPHPRWAIDGLVTNFHLPRSTLLMLVAALCGRDRILSAYEEARDAGYRFYSYGDAMLIL